MDETGSAFGTEDRKQRIVVAPAAAPMDQVWTDGGEVAAQRPMSTVSQSCVLLPAEDTCGQGV
jgi:hypothetical protein